MLLPLEDIYFIRALARTHNLRGFSVTIPHKTAVIPYLDELDEEAVAIGAVNTVKVEHRQDKIYMKGYNTDAPAFIETLKPLLRPDLNKALVLGSGGASRAVCHALIQLGIAYQIVSRTPAKLGHIAYASVTNEMMESYLLIINTTPLGMYPDITSMPSIPYEGISGRHLVYDLVYNPAETALIQKARQHGAATKNGLEMLGLQAQLAWAIWADNDK